MGDRYDRKSSLEGLARRLSLRRGKPPPTLLGWGLEKPATIGHNNGPPIEDEAPGYLWRRHRWTAAHEAAWKTPPLAVLKFRLARAEAAGLSYRDYMLTVLDTGRFPQAVDRDAARTAGLTRVRDAWNTTIARLAPASNRMNRGIVLSSLIAAYDAPPRAYHTLVHIGALLIDLDRHMPVTPATATSGLETSTRDALILAILFHDAVYDPTGKDNEAASARLARLHLTDLGVARPVIADVEALILATAHGTALPAAADAQLLSDLDLEILAAPPERYAAYAAAIRAEYAHVPDAAYRIGRARVLRTFLQRPFIYATPALRTLWEAPARTNLAGEISRLDPAS